MPPAARPTWRAASEPGASGTTARAARPPCRRAPCRAPRRAGRARLAGGPARLERPGPAADTYTLVEAMPDGWWYSALLADGRLAAAFMTDVDLLAPALAPRAPAAWPRRPP